MHYNVNRPWHHPDTENTQEKWTNELALIALGHTVGCTKARKCTSRFIKHRLPYTTAAATLDSGRSRYACL